MERIQQRTCHQILGPNHTCGPYKESPTETGETESCELRGQDEGKGEPVPKLEVIENFGNDNGVEGIRTTYRNICHDVDENVFLDVPWTFVQ